ncbi:MAG TPA: ABC transporter permease [Candidatus Angelobacter sp.]
MDWLQQSLQRLLSFFRRSKMDHELDAELGHHLDLAIEENMQRGLPADEARRQALIRFGGVQQAKEQHREARGLPALGTLLQDLRYAVRWIRKSPGFTAAAVLTLALGIALNATMFSLVSGFLLQRPPGREVDRVAVISSINPAPGFLPDATPVSTPNYLAWRASNTVFENIAAAHENRSVSLTWQNQSVALRAAAVSADYFTVLGVTPQAGRVFAEGEDQPGRDHVVILGHELWEQQFGSDASLLGRTIRLNREDYTVIGVMPSTFRLLGFTPQLWVPLAVRDADQTVAARKDRFLYLFARLKPGVTLEQARAEMATLARRAGEDFPGTEKGWGAAVRTLPDFLIYAFSIRSGLAVMMTAVGFVLLIACANVAGLLLARAGGRRKEMAIRLSLGASRLRIVRQLLTEGLVIAFLGGGIGLLLSYWGIHFVRASLSSSEVIRAVPFELDTNVLLFALSISVFSAVLCGLAPALSASRTDINTNLKNEGRAASTGRSHSRLRKVLVTGEITVALFLLIGSALLIRGIALVEHQKLGFQRDHLLTAGLTLDKARFKDASEQVRFVQDLIPRLQQIPGAEAAAVASDLPATGPAMVTLQIKGQPDLPANQRPSVLDVVITVDYFRAAGIPLLRGRTFTEMDNAAAPRVVVASEDFVHRILRDQEPFGKQICLDVGGATPACSEIVGVVGNVKTYSESTRNDPQVYEPFLQRPVPDFSLMMRAASDPNGLASAVRAAVAQVDVELPLTNLMSMSRVIELQGAGDEFFMRLLGTFAFLALILAAIGIYGLIAYYVGQRTHEIAIRIAMGARAQDVRRTVLWEGMKMTGIGAVIGLAIALPLPKLFQSMFADFVVFSDPRPYVIAPVAIIVVAVLATYIPARRASAIDPMMVLHSN